MRRFSGLHGGYLPSPYGPAEDTFFLEDHIRAKSGHLALDMGSGSGYLTRALLKSFEMVVGTDISHSVLCDQTYRTENLVCCNGADALGCLFDLIICNPPYLATDSIDDAATDGGPGGVVVPLRMILSAIPRLRRGGTLLFVTSSLSDYTALIDATRAVGLETTILARKKLFFEELILVEAVRSSS